MAIGTQFEKSKTEYFLDCLATGKSIEGVRTVDDMLALAGACFFSVLSLAPAYRRKRVPSSDGPVPGVGEHNLLRVGEAATYLRMKADTLYKKSVSGEVPSLKVGRLRLFRKADLDRWLDGKQSIPAGPAGMPGKR